MSCPLKMTFAKHAMVMMQGNNITIIIPEMQQPVDEWDKYTPVGCKNVAANQVCNHNMNQGSLLFREPKSLYHQPHELLVWVCYCQLRT